MEWAVSTKPNFFYDPMLAMAAEAKLWRPNVAQARRVVATDPADLIVTDFTREPPVTVTEDRPIEDALEDMNAAEVGALLVVRGDNVSGLITAQDVRDKLPAGAQNRARSQQIEVGQAMTPWCVVPKLGWSWIKASRVHDAALLFRRVLATHIVIVDPVSSDGFFVRALLSSARLTRQLGADLGPAYSCAGAFTPVYTGVSNDPIRARSTAAPPSHHSLK
jgi:hypothetical protein